MRLGCQFLRLPLLSHLPFMLKVHVFGVFCLSQRKPTWYWVRSIFAKAENSARLGGQIQDPQEWTDRRKRLVPSQNGPTRPSAGPGSGRSHPQARLHRGRSPRRPSAGQDAPHTRRLPPARGRRAGRPGRGSHPLLRAALRLRHRAQGPSRKLHRVRRKRLTSSTAGPIHGQRKKVFL